jgi:hypothetical protein
MILLHEEMPEEAAHLKDLVEHVFGIPVLVRSDNLDRFFVPLPKVQGYFYLPRRQLLLQHFPATAVLVLTPRDLYGGDRSKDDEWVFGANAYSAYHSAVATARLMGPDNAPRTSLAIDASLYLRRLSLLTIHELAHDLVKAPHFQNAFWVNVRNGTSMELGNHCVDHSCAMYEIVDITAPPKDEGYLKLGNDCFYDAGLDEHLQRLHDDWFCQQCRDHIVIVDEYRSIDVSSRLN